ncbi:TPA: hypothetical protein I4D82_05540 [Enterobacter cloacae]|nr:hypothetical protein [Enterobacter cloacae]
MIRMMRINPPALVLNSFIHLRAGFTTKSAVKQAIATSIVSNGVSGAEYISEKLIERYFGVRVLAILMTWEAMVAITLLQVVVTWISDDELQIWCEKCIFGAAPFNRSVADQNKALETAIKDIS